MPTKALSAEPTISAITADDKLVLVNNPAGTADTALITAANAALFFQNGMVATTQLGAATVGGVVGVATLGADGKVPLSQLPAITTGVTSFNTRTGVVSLVAADITALMTGSTGALPLARIVSTDGHTTADTIYVGINDPTSVAGGSFTPIDGDVWINPS